MTRAERLAEQEAHILAAITRAADEGRPCPINDQLVGLIGAKSNSVVVRVMHRLEHSGVIEVERFGMSRIVTIVATGKRTSGEVKSVHWRHRDPAAPVERKPKAKPAAEAVPVEPKPEPVRVDREPCTYCGIRADIGCKHTRRPAPALFPSVHR